MTGCDTQLFGVSFLSRLSVFEQGDIEMDSQQERTRMEGYDGLPSNALHHPSSSQQGKGALKVLSICTEANILASESG